MRLILAFILLVALSGVADRGVAAEGDEQVFCVNEARAERVACSAAYLDAVSICLNTYALETWIGYDDAASSLIECKEDALQERKECRAIIATCEEE
jgi:hypothetical protein